MVWAPMTGGGGMVCLRPETDGLGFLGLSLSLRVVSEEHSAVDDSAVEFETDLDGTARHL